MVDWALIKNQLSISLENRPDITVMVDWVLIKNQLSISLENRPDITVMVDWALKKINHLSLLRN